MRKFGMLLVAASVLALSGCVVSQEVYIENASVNSIVNHPPVNLTTDSSANQFRLSPHLAINHERAITGAIDPDMSLNRTAKLRWNFPDYAFGIAGDLGVGPTASLSAGFDWTSSQGTGLVNGHFGIGFHSFNGVTGFRFDAGILVSNRRFDAYAVVVTKVTPIFGSTTVDTAYFHDRGENTSLDFYAMLTFNGRISTSPINLFLSGGIFRQTLLTYSPQTSSELHTFTVIGGSADIEYRVTLLSITPGVSVNVSPNTRVLLGWRFVVPMYEDFHPGTLGIPFMQADFTF